MVRSGSPEESRVTFQVLNLVTESSDTRERNRQVKKRSRITRKDKE